MIASRNSIVPKRMIKILTRKLWVIFFVTAMACAACGAGPVSKDNERPNMELVMDASLPDAHTGISEIEARTLLDRMFREAGLRVLNDVAWTAQAIEVTLDGYDPERQIGYEYVDRREVGSELDASEFAALDSYPRIFLASACSHDQLMVAAELFLASVPAELPGGVDDSIEP